MSEHALWLSLDDTAPLSAVRHGSKAVRLAELRHAGLPTPPGWVLDVAGARSALQNASHRRQVADALLSLHSTRRWMLRSSSPFEDLPGQSAAGLFASVSAEAVPEDIMAALATVAGSGASEAVKELLDLDTDAPVAVLAQPQLDLSGWWTVELDAADGSGWFEGWTGTANAQWARGAVDDTSHLAPVLRRFAAWQEHGTWLLEIGRANDEFVLLQARPAPPRRDRSAWLSVTEVPERDDVPRFPLHPGDEDIEWKWDGAHSPTPLCPLLAGTFHLWLRERPESPSRIIHGRWHDRASEEPPPEMEASPDRHTCMAYIATLGAKLTGVSEVGRLLAEEPKRWPEFVESWLAFQGEYFGPAYDLMRRWARHHAQEMLFRGTPPVLETTAAARSHKLDDLARRLMNTVRPLTVTNIEFWYIEESLDPLRQEIFSFLRVHGHVAPLPWDGRSPTWSEDRRRLWRELLHRAGSTPRSRPERLVSPLAADAAASLTYGEEDDEVLSKAYSVWRNAAMHVASALSLSPRAREEVFDILPQDLEQLIESGDREAWRHAYQRGRSLATQWESWSPPGSADEETTRRGLAASGGRAEGRVRRLTSALADGGPRAGDVLVVPTITPTDAIVFPRLAGLITEQGEMLGHASILARDQGVPAVVGLADARRWLASTERVLIDGDSGLVTRL